MADEIDGYITKYALSAGIHRARLRLCDADGMVEEVGQRWATYYHGEGKDWHRTYASALKRAEAMRDAKIKSLRKSLDKMKAVTFQEPTT